MAALPESVSVTVNCPACGEPIGLRVRLEMTGPAEVTMTGDETPVREHVATRHPGAAAAAAVRKALGRTP